MFDVFLRRRRRKQTEIEKSGKSLTVKQFSMQSLFYSIIPVFSPYGKLHRRNRNRIRWIGRNFRGRFYRHTFICKWSVHWASYFHSSAPGMLPEQSLYLYPVCSYGLGQSYSHFSPLGSLAIIPVDKITSFVHNLVWIEITYLFADFAFPNVKFKAGVHQTALWTKATMLSTGMSATEPTVYTG